jgi:RimJ/RimL family protein N-acetyltransferase
MVVSNRFLLQLHKQFTYLVLDRRGSYHTDIQETATLILKSQPTPEEPWNVRYAILLRPGPSIRPTEENSKPKMIGVLGTPRESEVAYKLHPCYWAKGYMSEALAMFIKLYWQSDG